VRDGPRNDDNLSGGRMKQKQGSGIGFWLFMAVIIFVLYCLVMQRPYCRTLDMSLGQTNAVETTRTL
jgi:hypothetical protein